MKDKEQLSNILVYKKPKIYMTTENNVWSKFSFAIKIIIRTIGGTCINSVDQITDTVNVNFLS